MFVGVIVVCLLDVLVAFRTAFPILRSRRPSAVLAERPVRTLLIDNYDSYTYNLYQLLSVVNGVEPYVVYNDAYEGSWSALSGAIGHFDNIVLSPGPGRPDNSKDFGLCRDAIERSTVPLLGVCLGHQGLVHVHGGTVGKASAPMHGRLSAISHLGEDIFSGIANGSEVVRYHSLAAAEPLPAVLQATAWASDGTIQGLRHVNKPQFGVQFHPESIKTTVGRRILENFRDITIAHHNPMTISSAAHGGAFEASQPTTGNSHQCVRKVHVETIHAHSAACKLMDVFDAVYGSSATSFLLDSECPGPSASYPTAVEQSNRMSYMGDVDAPGSAVLEYQQTNQLLVHHSNGSSIMHNCSILEHIRQKLQAEKLVDVQVTHNGHVLDAEEVQRSLPFAGAGALFGYLGYELGMEVEQLLAKKEGHGGGYDLQSNCNDNTKREVPLALLLQPSVYVVLDHNKHDFHVVALCESTCTEKDRDDINAAQRAIVRKIRQALALAASAGSATADSATATDLSPLYAWKTKDQYKDDIKECLRNIVEGETYEVCLTVQFSGALQDSSASPTELYRLLRQRNSAPYASFIRYNYTNGQGDGFAVCCTSPERYLKVDQRDRQITSKPIKGTARRNLIDPQADIRIAKELHADEKSQSENLMVTDLVRNDLGRVCQIGSVTVPALMNIESYATVHQMVTTIAGKLRDDCDAVDALVATFPGGSMTGAPKLRTMQLIRKLEQRPRGIYSGSIGYIGLQGTMDMNIVIRTAVLQHGNITIGAGGAIIAMSDPDQVCVGCCLFCLLSNPCPAAGSGGGLAEGTISESAAGIRRALQVIQRIRCSFLGPCCL